MLEKWMLIDQKAFEKVHGSYVEDLLMIAFCSSSDKP